MKYLGRLALLFLLAAKAYATVTVTIDVSGITGGNLPGSSIVISLQHCATARIAGTGQIVPQSQTVYPHFGASTITLFDNSQINCSGQIVSYYSFSFIYQGVTTSIGSYNLPPGIYQLGNLTPCTGTACYGPAPPATPVTQIIAGSNVTISPSTGVGAVTINSTGGGGGGGLTSFTVSNLAPIFTAALGSSPLTSPALAFTLSSTSQNFFLAGPTSGTGVPTYRAIVAADIPTSLPAVSIGGNAATATTATSATTATTAANLSGTPALPNGTTATTQTVGDNTTKIATDAFVLANAVSGGGGMSGQTPGYAVEAATATTATGPFPLDDAVTLANYITAHKKLQVVSGGSDPSQFSLVQTGFAPTVVTSAFTLAAPTAVSTANTVVGFAAPCSGVWTLTNSAGVMASTCTTPSGTGTVTSASVVTANGVSGTVATATTTPAITLTLGAITPTSTNGVSAATMAFNDATSSIQTQLNGKQASGTYVTAVSVATANGVSGTSSGGATPALTIALGAITPTSVASTGAVSGTTGTFTGGVTAGVTGGVGGQVILPEGTAATASTGNDVCYGDSTAHDIKCSLNNGSFFPLVSTASAPLSISAAGVISAPTAVTSASSLTSNAVVIGGGSQASSTISADTTTTHALFATAGAPAFRALAATDVPAALSSTTSVNGTTIPASATLTQTIASGTSALGTAAIASGACATVVTTTATGTASTDAITWNPNGSIKAVTGYIPSTSGGLTISDYPTTNAVNWDVCNWTSASITPGAVTLNWRVAR